MAEPRKMTPRTKKVLVWSGMGAAGVAAFFLMNMQADKAEPLREPEQTGLLGSADTRAAGLEGLSQRVQELENELAQRTDPQVLGQLRDLSGKAETLERKVSTQNQQIQSLQRDLRAARDALAAGSPGEGSSAGPVGSSAASTPDGPSTSDAEPARNPGTTGRPSTPESRAALREELARGLNLASEEVYARPVETLYAAPPMVTTSAPVAPQIVSHAPPQPAPLPQAPVQIAARQKAAQEAEEWAEPSDSMERIPDLRVAAGSVLSAYLLTGLDAPTGSRADSNPIPVLMRIKIEARMPNYAHADVMDCHLIGAAYGDLASERVNIRGEKVSCTLDNGQVFDGQTKFFVTGEDGKNGIRGRLVNRSGKMLARTAYASIAQGVTGVLAGKTGGTTVNLGTGGTPADAAGASLGGLFGQNAGATAGQGFQRLGDYYMELAEQTFPVIEIANGRWVDVVLTDTMEVKFLRGSAYAAPGSSGVVYK